MKPTLLSVAAACTLVAAPQVTGKDGKNSRTDRFLALTRTDSGKMVSAQMRVTGIQAAGTSEVAVRIGLEQPNSGLLCIASVTLQDTPFADAKFAYVISEPWLGPVPDAGLLDTPRRDWMWFVDTFGLLEDPNYAREGGKPVVCIWGLPFPDRHISPETANAVVDFFKNDPKYGGNYVIGGIPANCRNSSQPWQEHIISQWPQRL